jgi:hypothetical protein
MAKQLAVSITRVMYLYLCRGFHVGTVLMDNEFIKLQNRVPIPVMNTMAATEHVSEVKQHIWLKKG